MKISDIRFKNILDNIFENISKSEDFKFKLEREVYINLGEVFFKFINKESWYTYNISTKIANYGAEFVFNCKFVKQTKKRG